MQELRPDVYSIRAIDWDRRLFDELIPLPEGTTYNAYLVEGDETVVIDLSAPSPGTLGTARHTYTIRDDEPPAVTITSPPVIAPATRYVPVSILSGMTV